VLCALGALFALPHGAGPRVGRDSRSADLQVGRDPGGADLQVGLGGWQSLFDGRTLGSWEETVFGGEGQVHVRDGAIILEFGEPLTGVTWRGPVSRADYEVRLAAQRLAGSDFFCGLTFPVADSACSLILGGWGGSVVGLSNLDRHDASDNETTQRVAFDDRRWYAVRVRVSGGRIQAWLDDRRIIDAPTTGRRIGIRPEVELSRPLGIAAYRTRAAVREIETRAVSAPE
jgi:hypothetical protein